MTSRIKSKGVYVGGEGGNVRGRRKERIVKKYHVSSGSLYHV